MSYLPAVHLEDIIQGLGGCGRFQVILTFIVHTMKCVVCFTMVAMTFGAAVPDWWCLDDLIGHNTSDVLGNKSLPQFQSCSYGNGTNDCSTFLYADSMKTVVTEVGMSLDCALLLFFIICFLAHLRRRLRETLRGWEAPSSSVVVRPHFQTTSPL
ncbi:MAG: hypothetical protein AB2700_09830, partial [Candidatus Thiodiazotropha taylori]